MNYLQIKKKASYYLVFIITMVLVISSCVEDIKDVSPIITQSFELDAFNGIALSIPGNVRIIEGQNQEVEITGRKETINEIKKTVNDGVWDIVLPNNYHKSYDELDIIITSNNIEKLILSGSGKITGEHILPLSNVIISGSGKIEAETESSILTSTISGSGRIDVSGKADELKHNILGSGNLNGFGLETTDAEISTSGSGKSKILVTSNLDVTIIGSGSVYYKGTPTITTNISGVGQIIDSN
ncbi:MAG: head GIN domain-containing protein [Tunicatimonas sp.]|uniref:head GIN domain-containing protein n=1 Tax=Tunicatimonas sp. TaxID=1940096 RepID=UPI003C749B6F